MTTRIKRLQNAKPLIDVHFEDMQFVVDLDNPDSTLKMSGKDLSDRIGRQPHTHPLAEVDGLPGELANKFDKKGGKITGDVDVTATMRVDALRVDNYLEVPELKYNRISATGNEMWITDANVVDDVWQDMDGVFLVTLKKQEGEIAVNFQFKDILRGVFYIENPDGTQGGFVYAFFEVTAIINETQFDCIPLNGIAPHKFMTLVRQGNKTNPRRQGSIYLDGMGKTIKVIDGVTDEKIEPRHIKIQMGNLEGFKHPVFGDLSGYSGYFDNVYICGRLVQRDPVTGTEWEVGSVALSGDQVFHYDSNGNVSPEKITIQATEHGITSQPAQRQWHYKKGDAWHIIAGANDLSYKLTHNAAIWDGRNTLTLRYIVSGTYEDILTITKLHDGKFGQDGRDGKDGAPGKDGKSEYTHIRYSANASGQPFSETPNTYIGIAVTNSATAPTANIAYKWTRLQGQPGQDGKQGNPGPAGADGRTPYVHTKYSDDGKTFTADDGETVGAWMGQYTDFTQADSMDFSKYTWVKIKGDPGQDGKSEYTHIRYSANASGQPFSETPNTYIGIAVTNSATAPTANTAYKWTRLQGQAGQDGKQGNPGPAGADGRTPFVHTKYSDDGKTFTADDGETVGAWMGQYTDFTQADSMDFSKYKWVKIKGQAGDLIYIKGTGFNRNARPEVTVNEVPVLTTYGRGHHLVVLKRTNLQVIFTGRFDTYGTAEAKGDLVNKINSFDDSHLIIIVSYDAVGWNQSLVDCLVNYGSQGNINTATGRYPYAFIGYRGLSRGLALEFQSGNGADDPFAEIATNIISGQFVGIGTAGPQGEPGQDGKSEYTHIRYSANANGQPFSETPNTYIGIAVTNSTTAPSANTGYKWTRLQGQPGQDGKSEYTHIRYSANANGNPMSTTANTYIGLAVTNSATAPTAYTAYKWARFQGQPGQDGQPGATGPAGPQGPVGDSITGKMLFRDPEFRKGMNNVARYNNTGTADVTVTRITRPADCPTTSSHIIEISVNGTNTRPELGGFAQIYYSRPNAVFIQCFIAKIPVGFKLARAANSLGTGSKDFFIGSVEGTGKYETYLRKTICGHDGTFSSGGHVFLQRTTGTTTLPIKWYLASCTVYDLTDSEYLDDVINEIRDEATAPRAVFFRGLFSSTAVYYNNKLRRDCVKYGSTYYLYKGTNAASGPWAASNWETFGGEFSSVATDILFTRLAYIENLGVKNLKTKTSGQRLEITESANNLAFYNDIYTQPVLELKTSTDPIYNGAGTGIFIQHGNSSLSSKISLTNSIYAFGGVDKGVNINSETPVDTPNMGALCCIDAAAYDDRKKRLNCGIFVKMRNWSGSAIYDDSDKYVGVYIPQGGIYITGMPYQNRSTNVLSGLVGAGYVGASATLSKSYVPRLLGGYLTVSKTATGKYRIRFNNPKTSLTATNYFVLIVPDTTSVSVCGNVLTKYTNYFDVILANGVIARDSSFHFLVFTTNHIM